MKDGLYKRGSTWYYRFKFGGRLIHECAKTQSRTVAKAARDKRRRELEQSYHGLKKRTLPPTFNKAASDWLKGREELFAASTITIGRVSVTHLVPVFGPKLLCDIEPEDVQRYQQMRLRDGAQGRTVNIEVQTLRQILKANKFKQLDGEIRPLKERKDVGRALTPEEETALLKACEANPLLHTVVVLALNTALRKSEIRLLKWSQIDFERRTLTVGKSKTAAGTGRVVPLNPLAFAALIKWAGRFPNSKAEHYVFPACENARIDTDKPDTAKIDPSRPIRGWRTAWRTARKLAGVKIRFHDLRHTAISKLAEGQASEQTIMSIAGHVSKQMLDHYSHIRMAAKRAALDALAQTPNPAILSDRGTLSGTQLENPAVPQANNDAKLLN